MNRKFPLIYLFPNLVTIISLCFGMSAIKYSLEGRWELAVGLLVTSAFLDGMDGRLARMLNASSKFGAELDSLTDFINFGVAPAFILYNWSLQYFPVKVIGWAVALIFTICGAFRLARFNSGLALDDVKMDKFFVGIPAPCGAGLTLIPIMVSFQYEFFLFKEIPAILAFYLLVIGFLMASQIPTISVKHIEISSKMMFPTLLLCTVFIVSLLLKPWIILPLMGVIYILTIPFSVICFLRNKK
ncbi:MAG: CDP-diacylglycerol--serine O-phosphatidyltransferase [Rickettsiales bacterium]|nr:CDP-diacylglycerol--serine O-phosphatidyltransferase [Rickettsiales bacterium]